MPSDDRCWRPEASQHLLQSALRSAKVSFLCLRGHCVQAVVPAGTCSLRNRLTAMDSIRYVCKMACQLYAQGAVHLMQHEAVKQYSLPVIAWIVRGDCAAKPYGLSRVMSVICAQGPESALLPAIVAQ